jgi:hypothetical protein
MTDTRKKRHDGIRTFADLVDRCRRDDETGCLIWAGARRGNMARVWIPGYGVKTMTGAFTQLCGKPLPEGKVWVPMCGRTDCANPAHRKPGTRSDVFRILRPKLTPTHIARTTLGKRKASRYYTPEAARDIKTSEEPARVLAERYGMHIVHVYKIRRGELWRDVVAGASVWGPAG